MLVAGAALLSGFLMGFIFAIPRVGSKEEKTRTAQAEGTQTPDSDPQADPIQFNDNLVQISDWLTKIIVGVGLVELHSIPGALGTLSYYLALGLQPAVRAGGVSPAESLASGQVTGLAILIFYFTLGFLLGYVWTMIDLKVGLQRLLRRNKYLKQKAEKLKREVEELEKQKDSLQLQTQAAKDLVSPEASVIISPEALISGGQLDEAMVSIDEAIKSEPRNGLALLTKARILKRQALQQKLPDQKLPDKNKLLKQALTYLDQAIALLPDKGEPIYNKACYQALLDPEGLKGEVLANLEAAFRLNPALRQDAKTDEDLSSIKQDADFIRLITQ
jgi:tetratricopeptide (TPR) repeat protein